MGDDNFTTSPPSEDSDNESDKTTVGFTTPVDSNGREFNPYTGSLEPQDGRCRALVTNWAARYGKKRYCTRLPEKTFIDDGSDRCKKHKGRDNLLMRADDLLDNGLEAKTVFHFYDKIHPTKKLLALKWYEQLMERSVYDFEWNLSPITIDFSDADDSLPTPTDERVEVDIQYATEYKDAATSLLLAATSKMKMLDVDSTLVLAGMERDTYEDSELDYESGDWNTLEGKDEHHLNLPNDRLIRTHGDLLEYGGVGIEDESEQRDESAETIIEVYENAGSKDDVDPEALHDDASLDLPVG